MTDKEILGIDNRVVLGQLFKLAFGTTPIYMPFPIGKPQKDGRLEITKNETNNLLNILQSLIRS